VPAYATAPVLVLVGMTMFQTVAGIAFGRIEDSLPAFVTLVLIPLTFSITQGILWGFVLHALLYTAVGRARQVPGILWVLAVISVGLLLLESRS
jgi:AGZA family xanthine/uracil permease-like MFS transporter